MKYVQLPIFSLLVGLEIILWVKNAQATNALCIETDCTVLGYTKTNTDCTGIFPRYYCPFDANKAMCGNSNSFVCPVGKYYDYSAGDINNFTIKKVADITSTYNNVCFEIDCDTSYNYGELESGENVEISGYYSYKDPSNTIIKWYGSKECPLYRCPHGYSAIIPPKDSSGNVRAHSPKTLCDFAESIKNQGRIYDCVNLYKSQIPEDCSVSSYCYSGGGCENNINCPSGYKETACSSSQTELAKLILSASLTCYSCQCQSIETLQSNKQCEEIGLITYNYVYSGNQVSECRTGDLKNYIYYSNNDFYLADTDGSYRHYSYSDYPVEIENQYSGYNEELNFIKDALEDSNLNPLSNKGSCQAKTFCVMNAHKNESGNCVCNDGYKKSSDDEIGLSWCEQE